MTRTWAALGALLLVLTLPFLVRPSHTPGGDRPAARSGETLVVLTPHNGAVRFEFGRAFQEAMAKKGRQVTIDWRTPGGTAEIARYLASEYTASFERHWTRVRGRAWSAAVAAGFMARGSASADRTESGEVAEARREFLASQVGSGMDVLFGGGSSEHIRHADAGRLVDAGLVQRHPDIFGPHGIPHEVRGQIYWDQQGRWVGTCVSSFGICFNEQLLQRLGVPAPARWDDLANGRLHGQLALADPTKSGAIAKAFETIIQAQMQRLGTVEGWATAMRLIRRIGGNARYFTDSSSKVVLDVAAGDAAAGMCIDFYGRFESESVAAIGHAERAGFVAPRGETATDPDPISLLRGAPHRQLAVEFMEFVMSEAGQRLWAFKRGTPGGPQRYTLRRLAILPRIYAPGFDAYRADPEENPYEVRQQVDYHPAWTGPLVGAMSFVIRVMCVDAEVELQQAYGALVAAGFPPQATAAFDDVTLVDYAAVSGPIRAALKSPDPLEEAAWARKLGHHFRALYRRVEQLARAGQ